MAQSLGIDSTTQYGAAECTPFHSECTPSGQSLHKPPAGPREAAPSGDSTHGPCRGKGPAGLRRAEDEEHGPAPTILNSCVDKKRHIVE